MTEAQVTDLRKFFPITERLVYLNHASSGPLCTPAVDAMKAYIDRFRFDGEVPYQEAEAVVEDAREMAARLVGAKPGEIAFTKNTSAGIIIAVNSIEWHPGDNLVMMERAFPTNTYPFDFLLPQVEKRYFSSDDLAHGPECIFRLCDRHTRAISLDWVHFLSGARADLNAIAAWCHTRALYLLVDAMQGLGAVNQPLGDLGIDFMYAGGNKWMLGPHGSGILYVNSHTLPKLKPANLGWLSAKWDDFNDIYSRKAMKSGASRFEEGTKNYIGIYGLRESLRMLLDAGMSEVATRIRRLVDSLRKRLEAMGFAAITPADPQRRAGIITVHKPGADMAALHARLKSQGCICSLRENRLRISPHFYNTEAEVERFCTAMADES